MTITRTLAAALAAAALTAPAAVAKPVQDTNASTAQAVVAARSTQDLRSPDARDAAMHPRVFGGPVKAAFGGPPSWPAEPHILPPATVAAAPEADDGIDATTIGLGLAGSLVAAGGLAGLALRTRRLQRA